MMTKAAKTSKLKALMATAALSVTMLLASGAISEAGTADTLAFKRVEQTCLEASRAGSMPLVSKVDASNIIQLVNAQSPDVQAVAIYALGELRDTRALTPLIAKLTDGDNHLRRIAARALGKIGDIRAVEPLVKLLESGREPLAVRCVAAEALGMIDHEHSRLALKAILTTDKYGLLQRTAENALNRISNFGG